MADDKNVQLSFPPAYFVSGVPEVSQQPPQKRSVKSKALFGYAVAVSTALIVTLILGGVYYYRSLDVIQETIRKFQVVDKSQSTPLTQDVEIDAARNVVVFYLNGDNIGTVAVLDYTKSMTGIYDPQSRKCYLIGGIRSKIVDLQTFENNYAKNSTIVESSKDVYNYVLADNYPVSDKTVLPYPLKAACLSLPVYWLEPAPTTSHALQKRSRCTLYSQKGCLGSYRTWYMTLIGNFNVNLTPPGVSYA